MSGFFNFVQKMSLIYSISGIRGTIGGSPQENLTPEHVFRFVLGFGRYILQNYAHRKPLLVVGRDGRASGHMIEALVTGILSSLGIDVNCLGISTTPTIEMAIPYYGACGGIMISASHNPAEWNALKLLNHKGEFLTQEELALLNQVIDNDIIQYPDYRHLGKIVCVGNFIDKHIEYITALKYVDCDAIRNARMRIVADGINSSGAIALSLLFDTLGVEDYIILNNTVDGNFAHNPEPLAEHLADLCEQVRTRNAHIGIAVDPDVDRLALVMENGEYMGEEYTQVLVADYILHHKKGPVVTNVSSSNAMDDVAAMHGVSCIRSAVGEVNVVAKMKETGAVFGGEGNGGVILPDLHYGRDALLGIAIILTYLARSQKTLSSLKSQFPAYSLVKEKIILPSFDLAQVFQKVEKFFAGQLFDRTDGLKIIFADSSWIHLRASNTEPIIRIYAEALSERRTRELVTDVKQLIDEI